MQREYRIDDLENVSMDFLKVLLDYKKSERKDEKSGIKKGAIIVGLSGNLGCGKTTLMQHVAKHLGISTNIISPTFVLRRDYATGVLTFLNLIHIDAYRLENPDHLMQVITKEELNDKNNLIVIEWPEMVYQNIFDLIFKLEHKSESERRIELVFRR